MQKSKIRDIREFMDSPLNLKVMKPVCTSTPVLPQTRKRKQPNADDDPKQMVLDAGQKNIGMTNCKEVSEFYMKLFKKLNFSVEWFIRSTLSRTDKPTMNIIIDSPI